ncbi:MAG: HAMP domain-containing histidine kinase [bacterium]|nr:HAMP domain-containing histidine kinase [bacterium]
MADLLSKRTQNLSTLLNGRVVVSFSLCLILALYLLFFNTGGFDSIKIKKLVLSNLESIDLTLEEKLHQYKERASFIYDKFRAKNLQHSRLKRKETLLILQKGAIKEYFGEIFYFRYKELDTAEWVFIKRKKSLFFMQKMAENIFYVRYFFHLENNFVLRRLKYNAAIQEIKFFKDKKEGRNSYRYNEAEDTYFYFHLLNRSDNQLALYLKFSKTDVENYYKKKKRYFLYFFLLGLFFLGFIYFHKRKTIISRVSWFFMLGVLFLFVSSAGENDLYLKFGKFFTFYSIYEVLMLLTAFISLLYLSREKFKRAFPCIILFDVSLIITLNFGDQIFKSVDFNFTQFSFKYITLVIIMLFLHLVPIFLIRGIFMKRSPFLMGVVVGVQAALVTVCFYAQEIIFLNVLLLSVIAFMLLFFKRKFFIRGMMIFLVAISIFLQVDTHSFKEKKEFIAGNLKQVFLNQNNYAKLIAREMVHQLNLESKKKNFHEFFLDGASYRLKSIWRKTMASRENIASGLFIVSPEGEILSHYSYQMQYLKVNIKTIFPFWAIEDAVADLYGKDTSLALASINVFRESEHLGSIFVQVLNSPELILRHQDKTNIFTLDNKIDGMDLSYIKLNADNRIIENPSNINLENVAGILEYNNQWTTFRFIDITFNGYIFKHNKNTIIIFFPAKTLFKNFAEIIKIFLFLLLMFLFLYFKELKRVDWKSIYYSYSIRVFSFLILISLFTAIIFSLFSLNFNAGSALSKSRQMMYERGRTAQNIGYNLLEKGSEFTQDHLVLISRILNSDVSVYENGILLDSSNFRKIINSQVANYLHSDVLNLLNVKNQKFVLLEENNRSHLYFKIYNYILDVEISYDWRMIFSEEGYYTNFIITLFFILTVIGFSSAFFFRNKIISPIAGLNKGMAEVEKGNLPHLDTIPSEIEIKNLYMGFNSMIEGIREQKKNISEISRMKTIIKLGRRVAHEVKNPLTPIKLSAEQILLALRDKNPNFEDIIKQSVNYIIDETDHLKKVSYGFLDLSRLDELSPVEFDLMWMATEEISNVMQLYGHIEFSIDGDTKHIEVTLDKVKIKQVLKNLISNSIDAVTVCKRKGEIRLAVKTGDGRVRIELVDNGIGMEEEVVQQVYNVDYSTKEIGTGLGLFIVKRIIELHKGRIDIESDKDKGTRIILDLPEKI